MSKGLKVTDLIDVDILQEIQDAFAKLTGMASISTDADGVAITKPSNFTDFCGKYTRNSKMGCQNCKLCDKRGGEEAMSQGKGIFYNCHAGLIDFSAPIVADGVLIGIFIGGQVLTKPLEKEEVVRIANEYDIPVEEYLEAAAKIPVVDKEKIDNAVKFLYIMGSTLSSMAYNKYLAREANEELARASKMKSDFLANMSHEIRTPMNAVIGMADIALREATSPTMIENLQQIKKSGKNLLTIINDILDFSKIESGKFAISEVNYKTFSLLCDVENIVRTRIGDKPLELIFDINPNIPTELYGDNIRIQQVLINIANNAVKFTNKGSVTIKIDCVESENGGVIICVSVKDTGIGIKKQDLGRIFDSFQQLDSKRNRNIEGTGLGLAISKQLLVLMNGDISIDSIYRKGSTFSFFVPQQVVDRTPFVSVKECKNVVTLVSNKLVKMQLNKDIVRLGSKCTQLSTIEELENIDGDNTDVIFVDDITVDDRVLEYLENNSHINCAIVVSDSFTTTKEAMPFTIITKPVSSAKVAAVLNGRKYIEYQDEKEEEFEFVAPDAKVLVVDDNEVNITVVKGLLEPLQMQLDSATSAKAALEMVAKKHYDLIFMDHMMPEVDGVEATRIIRRFHPEYNDVPIIALTANAMSGNREMFLNEGMNDFVPKPVELNVIVSILRKWLLPELIKKVEGNIFLEQNKANTNIKINGLDVEYALKMLGNEALFWAVLKDYYTVIDKKAELIRTYMQNDNIPEYTIEVHALKSSSRQIGALELSDMAAELEKAGNAKDTDMIRRYTESMLESYYKYKGILAQFFVETQEEGADLPEIDESKMHDFFDRMLQATQNLDMDQMECVVEEMKGYSYPKEQKVFLKQLSDAANNIDVIACESIVKEWQECIL